MDEISRDKPGTSLRRPRGRRPPPNYASKRVQFRLLVLVFLIMTVLMLMREARNPRNFQWLQWFQDARVPADQPPPARAEAPDCRVPVDTRPAQRSSVGAASSEPIVTAPANQIALENLLDKSLDRSLATAQLHGWSSVWESLGQPRRDVMRLGLWNFRHQRPLDANQRAQWPDLLAQLTQQLDRLSKPAHSGWWTRIRTG